MIADEDCAKFRGILSDFNIQGLDIDRAAQTYWDLSLFGGLAKSDDRSDRQNLHISGDTSTKWLAKLPREVAEVYADRYADALKNLGYADNSDWVTDCKPMSELAA
jgi:hypothetical protein